MTCVGCTYHEVLFLPRRACSLQLLMNFEIGLNDELIRLKVGKNVRVKNPIIEGVTIH